MAALIRDAADHGAMPFVAVRIAADGSAYSLPAHLGGRAEITQVKYLVLFPGPFHA